MMQTKDQIAKLDEWALEVQGLLQQVDNKTCMCKTSLFSIICLQLGWTAVCIVPHFDQLVSESGQAIVFLSVSVCLLWRFISYLWSQAEYDALAIEFNVFIDECRVCKRESLSSKNKERNDADFSQLQQDYGDFVRRYKCKSL